MFNNKKGMISALTGLAWGVITLAIIIGLGVVLLEKFAGNVAGCSSGFSYQTNGTETYTTGKCCNITSPSCTGTVNETATAGASSTIYYLNTQLGSTSGGLATWVPIVIVLVIAVFFLSYFMGRKSGKMV